MKRYIYGGIALALVPLVAFLSTRIGRALHREVSPGSAGALRFETVEAPRVAADSGEVNDPAQPFETSGGSASDAPDRSASPGTSSDAQRLSAQGVDDEPPHQWDAVQRSPAEVAAALRDAGAPVLDGGEIALSVPAFAGVQMVYDPNKPRTPRDGMIACVNTINACLDRKQATSGASGDPSLRRFDECVESAPRCKGRTPWLGDPAGDGCCPQACVDEYQTRRRAASDVRRALDALFEGACYPGLVEYVRGADARGP